MGLTFVSRYEILLGMRETYEIYYRPETHNGVKNEGNYMHIYQIELDEPFANRSNGEKFAGIGGTCVETGEYKRFRMDRVELMSNEVFA